MGQSESKPNPDLASASVPTTKSAPPSTIVVPPPPPRKRYMTQISPHLEECKNRWVEDTEKALIMSGEVQMTNHRYQVATPQQGPTAAAPQHSAESLGDTNCETLRSDVDRKNADALVGVAPCCFFHLLPPFGDELHNAVRQQWKNNTVTSSDNSGGGNQLDMDDIIDAIAETPGEVMHPPVHLPYMLECLIEVWEEEGLYE